MPVPNYNPHGMQTKDTSHSRFRPIEGKRRALSSSGLRHLIPDLELGFPRVPFSQGICENSDAKGIFVCRPCRENLVSSEVALGRV